MADSHLRAPFGSHPVFLAGWTDAAANAFLLTRADPRSVCLAIDSTLLAICEEAFAFHRSGQLHEAIDRYRRLLRLKPDLPLICNNLGHALAELGRPEDAIAEYQRAVELKPTYAQALCNLGAALTQLGRLDEAEAQFRRAIAVDTGCAAAYHNLGVILKERGRLDEARRAAKRAVRLAPRNTSYYEHLATVRPFEPGDRYLKALEALALEATKLEAPTLEATEQDAEALDTLAHNSAKADAPSLSAKDLIHLHFALARAHEDTGRADSAFAQLLAGNQLKRRHTTYDEAATLDRMDRTRELFTADFIAARQGSGVNSQRPVFIVGMPRSGTTLIEQILASHPAMFGAGELNILDRTIGSLGQALPGAPPFPDSASAMSPEHFRAIGASYVKQIEQLETPASRIVDKMPGNFLFAGLIHLAMPNATIIHAVRDPLDTCVSCFSILFTNQAQTYDLAELGRYYRHYRAVMAHWHRALPPGRIIDVHYEDLVGDLEGAARRLLAHCGLPWHPACLDFHRTKRTVRTASATQVRRPIYQTSVGRWRKYEKFLGPLMAELKDVHVPTPVGTANPKEANHA